MIRKSLRQLNVFPALAFLLITLAGVGVGRAQSTGTQPPSDQQNTQAAQQPAQSGSQEASDEESSSRRKAKAKNFNKWTFNVGGGASLTNGTTNVFVRGGGGVAAAGVARNYGRLFGFRLDFQFDNLPLRNSALQMAQASGASSHVYSLMLGPVVNIPVTKNWGGYILGGPGYFHRSGKLDSSTALPGSSCNAFFDWWGRCFNGSLPVDGNFLSESANQFGLYFGGGITRKIRPNVEIYGEFRDLHGTHSGVSTDLRPITIGVRW
jgi:hypothetical protein